MLRPCPLSSTTKILMRRELLLVCCILLAPLANALEVEPQECKKLQWTVEDVGQFKQNKFPADFFAPYVGKTIRNVRIETGQVFDANNPKENNWLYRGLDALHINTKPQVIAHQLLFKAGEPLDENKVHESARILRTRGYLASAYILPETACADTVDLVVVTRDAWSTEPDTSLSRNGGENKSGIGLSESNLLGYGNELAIGYEKVSDRTTINYDLTSPHIFNSHYYAHVSYADKSDGEDKIFELSKPFYSLQTPYGYGLSTINITEAEILRYGGEKRSTYLHAQERNEIFVGKALSVTPESTTRLLGGYTIENDEYSALITTHSALPQNEYNRYPWLSLRKIENHFGAFKNLQQIQRVEDVLLGSDFYLRLGYGAQALNNAQDVLLVQAYYSDVFASNDNNLLQWKTTFSAKDYIGETERFSLSQHLTYNHFLTDHSRWYAEGRFDYGEHLLPQDEFTLGGFSGLRGYPLDFQRGQQRYLITTEYRYFSELHVFNLFRVGGVAFAEAGKAWDSPLQQGQESLSDVGFGLRVSSSKARIGSVVHIDIAMPTAARGGIDKYQWVISTLQTF